MRAVLEQCIAVGEIFIAGAKLNIGLRVKKLLGALLESRAHFLFVQMPTGSALNKGRAKGVKFHQTIF